MVEPAHLAAGTTRVPFGRIFTVVHLAARAFAYLGNAVFSASTGDHPGNVG